MAAHLSDLTNTDAVVPLQLLFRGPIVRHSSESVSLALAFVPRTHSHLLKGAAGTGAVLPLWLSSLEEWEPFHTQEYESAK